METKKEQEVAAGYLEIEAGCHLTEKGSGTKNLSAQASQKRRTLLRRKTLIALELERGIQDRE